MAAPITPREVRRLTVAGGVALAVLVAYWTLWFTARGVVASDTSRSYEQFEGAFPLADAWLGVSVVLALVAVHRRRPAALLWLLCAGGAGVYLFCMDALYDVQHGTWTSGAGGAIELLINLLTLGLSVWFLRWAWRRRDALLSP